ncbi:RNA polymerase sigma factor, sigma-70 family [Anaerohalosphaera lusitana]|uniref:RNA polymerase sigma factor, sigma-70 family n=1 Tax=Anaerohalosphaera lusitana TaxID=1936003 RepID=A0A1U9NGS6_9BACT|nr:hypothetical protein [Anaerohalosphaera lusitana]AQT66967.1 RNA polymerase sigma factor, sigma-70 family [Anaerohalosphaera lusitana]
MSKVTVDLNKIEASDGRGSVFAGRIDMLRARAEVLSGKDRAIMEMYLDHGETFSKMARVAGVNEATIARRINRLVARLINSEYLTCLRNRSSLEGFELLVARDYFLEGLSQRKIARKRGTSVYRVRKALMNIQRLVKPGQGA